MFLRLFIHSLYSDQHAAQSESGYQHIHLCCRAEQAEQLHIRLSVTNAEQYRTSCYAASVAALTYWLLPTGTQQYRRMNADLQAVDKAQRQHLDNLRPEATEERQKELSKGANQALHALAPVYSLVILQHSTYKQVRHCTPSPLLM